MSYETSIGENQLLYQINITGTPTLVVDLLSSADLNELNNWQIQHRSQNTNLTNVVVLDGFIQSNAELSVRHKIGGVAETFLADEIAYFPYLDWHKKVYVSGVGTALVKFVIGFTRRHNA